LSSVVRWGAIIAFVSNLITDSVMSPDEFAPEVLANVR